MPAVFYPDARSEARLQNAVIVSLARLQGGGPSPAEYEYVFQRDGERVAVAGVCGGLDWHVREEGCQEDIHSLDLTYPQSLRCLLEQKSELGSTDDDFSFLRRIVHALLAAAGSGVWSDNTVRYVALTTREALTCVGVPATAHHVLDSLDGYLLLASLQIPPRE
ncbi:TPA: hypothetical protein QDZ42_000835 [Stenotrophomonas maltophilia]|nr:hypothetical protein [Stenotrophomonas maltophilia]HDS1042212.1 hypothetical protein [Stenotrophomonas maltophilia]